MKYLFYIEENKIKKVAKCTKKKYLKKYLVINFKKDFCLSIPDIRSDDPCSDPSSSVRQQTERKIVSQLRETMAENTFAESGNKKPNLHLKRDESI